MERKVYKALAAMLGAAYILLGVKYDHINTQLKETQSENGELRINEIHRRKEKDTLEMTIEVLETEKKELELENKKLKKEQKEKPSRGGDIVQKPKSVGSVPDHNAFKSYMDYRAITNRSSKQYKLQQKAKSVKGFRMLNGRYMIALGSAYGKVGDQVTIDLVNGVSIPCIIGDMKADKHTDKSNKIHLTDGSIIEFIVDTGSLSRGVKRMGDCSYADHINLRGKVKSIMK